MGEPPCRERPATRSGLGPKRPSGGFKQVIGDGLRLRTEEHRTAEVDGAVHVLNPMPTLECPISVRIA